MGTHIRTLVTLAIFAFTTIVRGQEAGSALTEAQQKFNAGEYRPALQLIAQELTRTRAPSPQSQGSPQRYELLMLRGECLLKIDQRANAGDAFSQAERSASTPQEYALAHATAMLIRGSANNTYVSRGRSREPIDIIDPNSRKQAFSAMKEDRRAALAPRLERATASTTLPPMFEVLAPLLDVATLEFAAAGAAPETQATLMDLGARARGLVNDELKRINARLNALEDASNSVVGGTVYVGRRGLYSNEAQEVRDLVEYLGQIIKTAREVRQRAQKLGFVAEAWEPIIADAGDLTDRAQAMLNIVP